MRLPTDVMFLLYWFLEVLLELVRLSVFEHIPLLNIKVLSLYYTSYLSLRWHNSFAMFVLFQFFQNSWDCLLPNIFAPPNLGLKSAHIICLQISNSMHMIIRQFLSCIFSYHLKLKLFTYCIYLDKNQTPPPPPPSNYGDLVSSVENLYSLDTHTDMKSF
jgi:hypothetical protein